MRLLVAAIEAAGFVADYQTDTLYLVEPDPHCTAPARVSVLWGCHMAYMDVNGVSLPEALHYSHMDDLAESIIAAYRTA
jgi:hypothetical protein